MHFSTIFQQGVDILLAPYSLDYDALKNCILSNDPAAFQSAIRDSIGSLETFCTNRVQLIREDLCGSLSFTLVGALKQEIRNIVNLIDLNIQAVHKLARKFENTFKQPCVCDVGVLDEHLTYLRSVLLKESLDKAYAAFNLSSIVPFDISAYIANDDSVSLQSSEFYSAVVKNPGFLVSVAKILLVNNSFNCFDCLKPFLGEKIAIAEVIRYMSHRKSLLEPLAGFFSRLSLESFDLFDMCSVETIQACVDSDCYALVCSVVKCLATRPPVVVPHACISSAIRNQNVQILERILPLVVQIGQNDWHYFFRTCCQTDSHDCLRELIQAGRSGGEKFQLAHLLILCAKCDSVDCLGVLLSGDVDMDYREKSTGRTALIEAIRHGSPRCANLLLTHNASQAATDSDNWSAMDHDIYRGTRVLYEPAPVRSNVRSSPYIANTRRLNQTIDEDVLRVYFAVDFEKPVGNDWRLLFDDVTRVQISVLMGKHSGSVIFTSSLLPLHMVDGSFDMNICGDINISTHTDSVLLIHMHTDTGQMLSTGILSLEPTADHGGIAHVKVPMLAANGKCILGNFCAVLMHVQKYIHSQAASPRCAGFLNQKPWLIGHRGYGASQHVHSDVQENTIPSFLAAIQAGAEFIEFGTHYKLNVVDVQVTKDLVPVLYHDFIFKESGINCTVASITSQRFKTKVCGCAKNGPVYAERPSIQDEFSTLREALENLPLSLGFNVEVKYPTKVESQYFSAFHKHNINDFCNAILDELFERGLGRNIFISSFNPDICMVFRLKQSQFPVFLLTDGGFDRDSHCMPIRDACKFASNNYLHGLVCEATPLVRAPNILLHLRERGLFVFTYGESNNHAEHVDLQIKHGVNGIITDKLNGILRVFSVPA